MVVKKSATELFLFEEKPIDYNDFKSDFIKWFSTLNIDFELNKIFTNENNKYKTDIYIPSKSFTINLYELKEISEVKGNFKDKKVHVKPLDYFLKNNITLLQLWDTEWFNKKDIIKSVVMAKLGLLTNKIFARKCNIIKVESKIATKFYNDNHLQGLKIGGGIHLGLEYNNEIVLMCSFSKSRFNKNFEYEILRLATKKNTIVVGGFTRLFKHFVNEYQPASIITYADRRISKGESYKNNGFEEREISNPNYFYTKDYINYFSRVKFQRHKLKELLEIFDENKSEVENMHANNWDRFFDAGNLVFGIKYRDWTRPIKE